MTIAVGMSGGVDSSVAAAILAEHNNVVGITMRLWKDSYPETSACFSPTKKTEIEECKRICKQLNIPHYVIDLSDEFESYVLNYYRDEYANGRTPNPCVRCNSTIKFGLFLEKAREAVDFDWFATGHYAGKVGYQQRFYLESNGNKDQTYFMYQIDQAVLDRVIFPLAGKTKEEVRELARHYNLPVAEKNDSQDFVSPSDIDILSRAGDIIYNGEVIGQHTGLTNYTIGQRKGLNTRFNIPLYVKRLDVLNNQLIVSQLDDLYQRQCEIKDNYIMPHGHLKGDITAKIRSGHTPAVIENINGSVITFKDNQKSITPGQSVVLYKDDTVIGGGIIVK